MEFGLHSFPGNTALRMLPQLVSAAFKLGDLFRREFVIKFIEFVAQLFKDFALFFKRKFVNLLQNLGRTHGCNLLL